MLCECRSRGARGHALGKRLRPDPPPPARPKRIGQRRAPSQRISVGSQRPGARLAMTDGVSESETQKLALMREAAPRPAQTLVEVLRIALPSTAGYLLTLSCDVTSTAFLGRSGGPPHTLCVCVC